MIYPQCSVTDTYDEGKRCYTIMPSNRVLIAPVKRRKATEAAIKREAKVTNPVDAVNIWRSNISGNMRLMFETVK
jgi:hypothetical protein